MASRNDSSNINFVPPYEWMMTNDIPPNSHVGTITASSINGLSIIYFLTTLYVKYANSTKAFYSRAKFTEMLERTPPNISQFVLTKFEGQLYTTNYFKVQNADFYLNVLATDSMGSSKQQIYVVKIRNKNKESKHVVKRRYAFVQNVPTNKTIEAYLGSNVVLEWNFDCRNTSMAVTSADLYVENIKLDYLVYTVSSSKALTANGEKLFPNERLVVDNANLNTGILKLTLKNVEIKDEEKKFILRVAYTDKPQKISTITVGFVKEKIYEVRVVTGRETSCGTDANVFLTIFGENSNSGKLDLKESLTNSDKFECGQTDVFNITISSLGKLMKIRVGHDNKNSAAGWFLSHIDIIDHSDNRLYHFSCEQWLAKDVGDGSIIKDFPLTRETNLSSVFGPTVQPDKNIVPYFGSNVVLKWNFDGRNTFTTVKSADLYVEQNSMDSLLYFNSSSKALTSNGEKLFPKKRLVVDDANLDTGILKLTLQNVEIKDEGKKFILKVLYNDQFPKTSIITIGLVRVVPGVPQNLAVIYKTSTTVKLLWKPPEATNQSVEVTNYTIVYGSKEIYSLTADYLLLNLNSSTSYNISVYANNKFVFNAKRNYTWKFANTVVVTNSERRSSNDSEELENLSKTKICGDTNQADCQTVTETANDLSKILESNKNLTENDVKEVDKILKKIIPNMKNLSLSEISKVSENVLDSIDQIANKTNSNAVNDNMLIQSSMTNKIVKRMDEISEVILEKLSTSNRTNPIEIKAKSIAFSALKINRTNIKISVQEESTPGFPIIFEKTSNRNNYGGTYAIEVHIPEETFGLEQSDIAISCTVQKTSYLFPTNSEILKAQGHKADENTIVQSFVIAVKIGNRKVENLTNPITLRFKKKQEQAEGEATVNFWDVDKENGRGAWSTEGIETKTDPLEEFIIGQTNHLTNFALLLDIVGPVYNPYELRLVSLVGIGISITCLSFSLFTLLIFRKTLLKKLANKILMSLCTSLLFLLLIFVFGVERTSVKLECQVISAMIHYFLLSTFLWMFIEACNLYISLVKVSVGLNQMNYFIISTVLSWGLPAIIVAACIALNSDHYSGVIREVCIVSGDSFHFGVVLPIALVLLFNGVIFVVTMKNIVSRRLKPLSAHLQKNDKRLITATDVRIAFALNLLLGVTWVFAFFAISKAKIVMQWLFCVTNALQGLFIFLFHIARNNDVKKEWQRLICQRYHGFNSLSKNYPANTKSTSVTKEEKEDTELHRLTVPTDKID